MDRAGSVLAAPDDRRDRLRAIRARGGAVDRRERTRPWPAWGIAVWAMTTFLALAAYGALLRATTHHHGLAGVTFALGGLTLGEPSRSSRRRLMQMAPRSRSVGAGGARDDDHRSPLVCAAGRRDSGRARLAAATSLPPRSSTCSPSRIAAGALSREGVRPGRVARARRAPAGAGSARARVGAPEPGAGADRGDPRARAGLRGGGDPNGRARWRPLTRPPNSLCCAARFAALEVAVQRTPENAELQPVPGRPELVRRTDGGGPPLRPPRLPPSDGRNSVRRRRRPGRSLRRSPRCDPQQSAT